MCTTSTIEMDPFWLFVVNIFPFSSLTIKFDKNNSKTADNNSDPSKWRLRTTTLVPDGIPSLDELL